MDDEQMPDEEEMEEEEPEQDEMQPRKTKGLRNKAKVKASSTIKNALAKGAKITFKIVATHPVASLVVLLVIVIIVILIILISKVEAKETADTMTTEVNNIVNVENSGLSDEAKEAFKTSVSMLKFPLSVINTIYDNFNKNNEYSSVAKESFNYIIGTKEIKEGDTSAGSTQGSTTQGNNTWDQGGLENVKFEVPGEEYNFNVTFYTDLPTEESASTRLTNAGDALTFGIIASNVIPLNSKVLLDGHGVFTVKDTGIAGLEPEENIAVFVPKKANESDNDYKKRVEKYNKEKIKGKIISVEDYSSYIYNDVSTTNSNYKWDLGGLQKYEWSSLEGEEIDFELTFYCGVNNAMEGGAIGAHSNVLTWGNVASNYWSGVLSPSWGKSGSGRTFGTKIYLKDVGTFTVEDRGGSKDFNQKNRIDVFIPRKSGESDSDWEKRTNSYGKVKIKGKVLPESYDGHQHGS